MRHRKSRRRIQRNFSHRKSLLQNLVRSLFSFQQIKTTHVKAKEAQRLADQLITLGKRNDLHSRRQAFAILQDKDMVKKLFSDIAPLFKDRQGGYTRVLHMNERKGDNAPMALLELVEKQEVAVKEKPKKAVKKQVQELSQGSASEETKTAEPKAKDSDKDSFLGNLKKFFKRKRED